MKKVGFVSIVGKTNAGKSTLLNLIMQQKISIATSKPQTTRNSIQGIYSDDESQIVFIDTPGIVKTHQKLDRFMNKQISYSLIDIDALVILIDAGVPFNSDTDIILKDRFEKKVPTFIVFNKIDLTNIYLIDNLKKKYAELFGLSMTDMTAIRNITQTDMDKIFKKNLSYSGMRSELSL